MVNLTPVAKNVIDHPEFPFAPKPPGRPLQPPRELIRLTVPNDALSFRG